MGSTKFYKKLILLAKTLFYCEILKCKRIFLHYNYWFIKKSIIYRKFKLHLYINNRAQCTLIKDNSFIFLYYATYLNPDLKKISLFLPEVLRNLPKYIITSNELFIYIYTIGSFVFDIMYPPLCFYENILSSNNFTKIRIISDEHSFIISRLLEKYNNIKYESELSFKKKIGYLSNAYNIIGFNSYFFYFIYLFNNNLKNVYEFVINYLDEPIFDEIKFIELFIRKNISFFKYDIDYDYKNKFFSLPDMYSRFNLMLNYNCNID